MIVVVVIIVVIDFNDFNDIALQNPAAVKKKSNSSTNRFNHNENESSQNGRNKIKEGSRSRKSEIAVVAHLKEKDVFRHFRLLDPHRGDDAGKRHRSRPLNVVVECAKIGTVSEE